MRRKVGKDIERQKKCVDLKAINSFLANALNSYPLKISKY